jgi:hypothetical protein
MRFQDMFVVRYVRRPVARRRARRPHVERLEGRAVPTGYTASNVTELINSIYAAHQTAGADTITLAAGTTFTLTVADTSSDNGDGPNGLPAIAAGDDLTIVGNGAVIERSTNNEGFRFFDVAAGGSLTLQDLTLQGGYTRSGGGALFNRGTLTLDRVIVQNNKATNVAAGGGVYSVGSLILEGSTIRGNSAVGSRGRDGSYFFFGNQWFVEPGSPGGSAYGGGVYIGGGTVSISNSSITANTARGGDGGTGVNAKPGGVLLRSAGGDGGNGFGGGLYAALGSITVRNSDIKQNGAVGGSGGKAAGNAAQGQPGQGVGGAVYIVVDPITSEPLASVGLDAFTVSHTKGNKASTADNDIHGPYGLIP